MQRAIVAIGIASLVLVSLNFILDFKRLSDLDAGRFDLESAQREHEEWFHAAEDGLKRSKAAFERDIAKALAFTKEFQSLSRSEAETLEILRKLVSDLGVEFERLKSAVEAAVPPPAEETPETAEEVKRNTLTDRLLGTSLEKIAAFDESRRKSPNTYGARLESKLMSSTHWDAWQIVHDLKEHYGVDLNHNDEALLYLKFDCYERSMNTTQAYHQASLDQKVYEMIERDGEGAYAPENAPPLSKEESKKVLSSVSKGRFLIRFMNDENPDLYRSAMIPQYVVHSLVDEVKDFFEKKAAR